MNNLKHYIIAIIKRIIPERWKTKFDAYKLLQNGDEIIIYGKEPFNERAKHAITKIRPDLLENKAEYEKMRKKMAYGYVKWKAHPSEFLLMNMDVNSHAVNDTFLTDYQRDSILLKYSSYDKFFELQDKYSVYLRLKEFFGRSAILVNKDTTWEEFSQFIKRYNNVFLKPLKGSFGKDAQIIKFTNNELELKSLFEKLKLSDWIAEELIIQDSSMSKWNPSSVNTIRIPSILTSAGAEILAPTMRCGHTGAIIDNAGGGGYIVPFNAATGQLLGIGRTEDGLYHSMHPGSKLKFEGTIPQYNQLIELNKRVHSVMSDHKYLGNDYALTPNGWILIECNWGQFITQYATGHGIKKEFEYLLTQ